MEAALRAALSARLATVGGIPTIIAGENTEVDPAITATWLRTQLVYGRRDRITAPAQGAYVVQDGLWLVDIFAPMGGGPDAADTLALAILAAFPDGLTLIDTLDSGGQRVRCTGSRRDGGFRGESWYQVPCQVRWQRHTTQTLS